MYCMKCGSFIKDGEKFCGSCGEPQTDDAKVIQPIQPQPQIIYVVQQPQEKPLSPVYIALSYVFFAFFLILGIYALFSGNIESKQGLSSYKAITIILTAFVFHPNVKVSSASPFFAFGAKFLVALLLLLFF